MIGYVTLGTKDFDKAAAFYDALFGVLGVGRLMDEETFIAWGPGMGSPAVSIVRNCANGEVASVGNGVMIALAMDAPDKVDAVYAKAIELGGADEGGPGFRGDTFYAGYFRDLDGNKLNAFCIKPAEG